VILHIIGSSLILSSGAYINSYINFVNKNFFNEEHVFVALYEVPAGSSYSKTASDIKSVIHEFPISFRPMGFIKSYGKLVALRKLAKKADRIIVHSLSSSRVVYWLALDKHLLRKTVWILWGGVTYLKNNAVFGKVQRF